MLPPAPSILPVPELLVPTQQWFLDNPLIDPLNNSDLEELEKDEDLSESLVVWVALPVWMPYRVHRDDEDVMPELIPPEPHAFDVDWFPTNVKPFSSPLSRGVKLFSLLLPHDVKLLCQLQLSLPVLHSSP